MMKKSVYSLVLADDVVEAIDRLAYSLGTNRSNLINQILAERVSLMTPEMRMRDIFDRIERLMTGRVLQVAQSGGTAMMLKSPLKYKYRPTVNYSVELTRTFAGALGRLKVSLRTHNEGLIGHINGFFRCWVELEKKYLSGQNDRKVLWSGENASYVREFYSPGAANISDEELAKALGGYVVMLDECIRLYFENGNTEEALGKIEREYIKYLGESDIIL